MISLPADCLRDGIYYLSLPGDFNSKEKLYLKVREKEGRIYKDDTLRLLPKVMPGHTQYKEWRLRKITADKLVKHFSKYSSLNILDVGAGNCWLSNIISSETGNMVYAIDLNEKELKQGVRIFKNNKKLKFIYGDILRDINNQLFDAVLFVSSIQYFPDLVNTIKKTLAFIHPGGYILIADSNFYKDEEIASAKERTKKYYDELGFPEAADNYFHHSYMDLFNFNPEITENRSFIHKILSRTGLKKISPFPWIRINKQ